MNDEEINGFWKSLEARIEEEDLRPSSRVWAKGSPHNVVDRIAELYTDGFLPIVLVQILLLAMAADSSANLVFWGGVLLSPILAWVFRPLCLSEFGLSIPKFFALGLALIFVLPLTQFGPAIAVDNLGGESYFVKSLSWIFVETAQAQLEGVLRGWGGLILLLVLVALATLSETIESRFPWVEHVEPRAWHKLPGWILIMIPALLVAWVLWPNEKHEEWRESIRGEYESTFLSRLPKESDSRTWRRLETQLRALPESKDVVWKEYDPSQEAYKILDRSEREFFDALRHSKPDSLAELKAAQNARFLLHTKSAYLKRATRVSLAELNPMFKGLGQALSLSNVQGWISNPERSREQLADAEESLRQANERFLSSVLGADLFVYHRVYGSGKPLLLPSFYGVTAKGKFHGSRARAAREEPMVVGAWSTRLSPKNLLLSLDKATFLEAWLETRPMFEDGLDSEEAAALTFSGAWTPDMGAARYYQNRFFFSFRNDLHLDQLQDLLLYVRMRQVEKSKLEGLKLEAELLERGWRLSAKPEKSGIYLENESKQISWRL